MQFIRDIYAAKMAAKQPVIRLGEGVRCHENCWKKGQRKGSRGKGLEDNLEFTFTFPSVPE